MNVPREEIGSFESLMFLIEQAAWFYEDFYREKDKTLRNLGLREFAQLLFNACPELYQLYGDQSSLDAQYRYVLFTAHLLFSCPVHLRQGCADVDGGPVPRTHHAAWTLSFAVIDVLFFPLVVVGTNFSLRDHLHSIPLPLRHI